VIGQDLKVLFCGINPGRYSGAVGHHFARPGNRFWKALHAAGFTPRVLSPFEEQALLEYGLGSPTWSSGRRPRPPSYGVRSWRRVPVV
jgi:TDG/mug DNA glycosylase family protein